MSEIEAKKIFEEGILKFQSKEYDSAKTLFEKALEIFPDRPSILENLAITNFFLKDYINCEKILDHLEILNVKKNNLHELRFQTYLALFKYDKIKIFCNKYKSFIESNERIELQIKLLYPMTFMDQNEIDLEKKKFLENLGSIKSEATLDINKIKINPPIFNLSYDQYNNYEINKKVVETFRKIYPDLNKDFTNNIKNKKTKIGFISEFLTNHTVGKLFKGLIFNLDNNYFDISIFHLNKTKKGPVFDEFVHKESLGYLENIILPNNFNEQVNVIKNKNLDIAFFPEIGLSTEVYYLSFIRFAKTQITSWGHGITTANDSIDYFISSKLLETDGTKDDFSEKFLSLNYLPMYFYKPVIENKISLEQSSELNNYFCSQNLIKFHPDFDNIMNEIIKKDKKANISIIFDERIGNKILERLKKNLKSNFEKINVLKKMNTDEYINTCGKSSVLLDTLYFGAGNSFHESMFYGTPTVSMPTNAFKSRIVYGAYKQMKIDKPPIVKSKDEYVEKAIEIANFDKKKLLEIKDYYRTQAEKHLFENTNVLSEFNNCLKNLKSLDK